jgi:hypothetical protein
MKPCVFLVSVLVGSIGLSTLTAGEQSLQTRTIDPKKVKPIGEEAAEQPLDTLLSRCQKMLDRQIAVYNGTRGLYKVIQGTADKQPRPEDQQTSLKLSDNEKANVAEATNAINMLEAEESAVAFVEALRELREDMKRVQQRLEISDVGIATQAIEQDIIDTLTDLITALKKG